MSEIFRNAVFGSNTTIVVGNGTIQGITNNVIVNDLESLAATLRSHGVVEEDIGSLRQAIVLDASSEDVKSKKLGPAIRGWIAAMVAKAASGAWEIGLATAGGVLAAAISAYYGFGGA